jgi:AcrR family transcriptional regulator
MTITFEREIDGDAPRRRLPIQVANEARMVRATIELLETHEVGQITSRMIAETSGTATNYISRYFGGRDGLLAATATELGDRIAAQIDGFHHQPGLDDPGVFLAHALSVPETALWFKLHRHLAGRDLPTRTRTGGKPPLIAACDTAVAQIFRIEGEEVTFWSNVILTYLMGNVTFGDLLGTTAEEFDRHLELLAAVIETLRDRRIPLVP